MDTLSAFIKGEVNRNKEQMVFDWDKAAHLIKEKKPSVASAGLAGDWECTGGSIYKDGKPVEEKDTYVYLASTWATPQLAMDGNYQDCYKMQSEVPDWNEKTYWPKSALDILNS